MCARAAIRIHLLGGLLLFQPATAGCSSHGEGRKEAKESQRSAEPAPPPPVARTPKKSDAGKREPLKRIFAKKFMAPVYPEPNRRSKRIGYLRAGSVLTATSAKPVGNEMCRGGWYGLQTGGFVCSKRDVVAFTGEKLPDRRAAQADRDAKLPYTYGRILRDRTPVYRRIPSAEELAPPKPRPPLSGSQQGDGPAAMARGAADGGAKALPPASARHAAPFATGPEESAPSRGQPANGDGTATAAIQPRDAGPLTLADLTAEKGGLIERWLMKGFHVALDRELERGGRKYWQTQASGFIAYDRVRTVNDTEFQGIDLEQGEWSLPLGYVLSSKTWCYTLDERERLRRADRPGYHHRFRIAGQGEKGGKSYLVSDDGRYFRKSKVARIDAREPPQNVGEDEKWIDVDLCSQSLVAYVGARPVYATLISSGRVDLSARPPKDLPTPTGSFRIERKHLTHTMEGDTAFDGPYSVEDVPYVMYFQLAYALHSAFWHNAFGRPRSHGCINMAPQDARWLFNWISPELPPAWHVAYPVEGTQGTRLYIRGKTPAG